MDRKRFILFTCFASLFYPNEMKAMSMKKDTIHYDSIMAQMLNDENSINSFCYDKKLAINKGKEENCLFTNDFLKSLFTKLSANNQKIINTKKSTYCIKYGYVKISDSLLESPESDDYLVYYFVTFEKMDTLMNRYISELKCNPYDSVFTPLEGADICYLFMKGDVLVVLTVALRTDYENENFMENLIELIKQ